MGAHEMNRPFAGRPIIMELAAREPFRLGNATVDPVAHEAHWPGGDERLQPQAFKVLIALVAKRGDVVTRDELVELCWGGRIVGDDVINRAVSLLRPFAERAGGFSIETVPRVGYRLVEDGNGNQAKRRRQVAMAGAVTLVIAAVGGGVFLIARQPTTAPPDLIVAVRPFTAPSGDSTSKDLANRADDATARMLTESGISVIDSDPLSTPSAKSDFILTGSVAQVANELVATVRVEDVVHHSIVMTRQIEATPADPEALPDQVGAQVSAALSNAAPLVRLDRAYPSDPALLINILNSNSSEFESQRNFEIARRIAPNAPYSAIAQLSLALTTGLNLEVIPGDQRPAALAAGREAAARLLQLAPRFGDSHLPWCFLHAEVRIAECEAELEEGLAVDPRAQSIGIVLGKLLINVGRLDDAVAMGKETLAKNPYGGTQMTRLVLALEAAGNSQDADSLFRRSHELRPKAVGMYLDRVSGMLGRGDFDTLAKFENQISASGLAPRYKSLAGPLARAIDQRSLPLAQASCRSVAKDDDLQNTECMLALARLGGMDESFAFADRLYPQRTARTTAEEDAIWLANPDNFDTLYLTGAGAAPMRKDTRYLRLANQLGLLRYWRQKALPDFCTKNHEQICAKIAQR
jgi:DNA-binding winged helix-turn-helix (wHTH) protein/tetratricopeptide (TPR) repeat protein